MVRVVDQKTAVVPLHADTLADPDKLLASLRSLLDRRVRQPAFRIDAAGAEERLVERERTEELLGLEADHRHQITTNLTARRTGALRDRLA